MRLFACSLAICFFITGQIAAQKKYAEIEVTHGGAISGSVVLNAGSTPAFKADVMDVTKDARCCGGAKNSPRCLAGKKGGVGNVIVYLEGIERGKKMGAADKFTLTQKHCEYSPHVTILPLGSQLEIVNDDPILHNVHAYDDKNLSASIFNVAQPIKGQRTTVKAAQLNKPGLICASCDAGHPWMSAYIMVAEHPYYVLTGPDGQFSLKDIPPGDYHLCMWHEGVKIVKKDLEGGKVKKYFYEDPYSETKDVSIHPDSTTHVDFEVALRP
jgi:hypothetical protein